MQKMTNSFSLPPVYLLADLNIETGNFAGGHYISENDFSESVITTVRLIWQGTAARDIQTHIGGEPHTYLNYQHLLNHGIEPSRFPPNAIYYQQPPTFFQKYKKDTPDTGHNQFSDQCLQIHFQRNYKNGI